MCRWLSDPEVYRWVGGHPRPYSELCAKYLPRIRGDEPTRCFLIRLDGEAIGHIQSYRIADYPEYESQVGLSGELAGVDLFIGEKAHRHRGLGAVILRCFLAEHVFATPSTTGCVLSPDPKNTSAVRAYRKAGFSLVRPIQTNNGEEHLMYIGRNALAPAPHQRWLLSAARILLAPYLAGLAYLTLRPSYPQAIEATYNALGRGYLHIPAYFGLGVLAFLSLPICSRRFAHPAAIATIGCILYGALLEILQLLVPGRTPNSLGILLNTLGATAGVALAAVFRKRPATHSF